MFAFLARPKFIRIIGFLVLQIGFLSLALVCVNTPLLMKSTSTSSEVHGAFSVLFIAWQFIASLLVFDLLSQVLSEEWSFQLVDHPFQPGYDMVSTLTSNVFFHTCHVFTQPSSMAYKAAVCALALLTILRTIAPASITTTIAQGWFSEPILLAKYTPTTFNPADRNDPVMASIQRAKVFVRIEQDMGTKIGWGSTENVLIGRQEKEVVIPNVTTTYPSDIVKFGFRCAWTTPQVRREGTELVIQDNQTQWKVWNSKSVNDIVTGMYPLYDAARSFDSRSAYLFVGCDDPSLNCTFRFQGMPLGELPRPSQSWLPTSMPPHLSTGVLICDPHYNLTTSFVTASGTTLLVGSNPQNEPSPSNIPNGVAELAFSTALLSALSPFSASPGNRSLISSTANKIFLRPNNQRIGALLDPSNFTADIQDLDAIQENLNGAMISASKAFLIKPAGQGSGRFTGFQTITVTATIQRPITALIGSRPFIFTTISLILVIILCGFLILLDSRSHHRLPLNLQSALMVLAHRSVSVHEGNNTEPSPQNIPLPLTGGNFSPPTQRSSDIQWYWPRRYVFSRLILFLFSQLAYYAIALKGYFRPYGLSQILPTPLTSFFAELTGAFTVAFTIWHTLSISLLSDIILTVFSLEWVVQAEKNRLLEPGRTDRVSTLASGLFDRTKYAFAKNQSASAMFRYAFSTSIALMILSATGPNCFTLSNTAVVPKDTTIQGGNPATAFSVNLRRGFLLDNEVSVLESAATVVQLEQLEGFTWGYDIPPKYFLMWPYHNNGGAIHEPTQTKYFGNTIHFDVKCRWEDPKASDLVVHLDTGNPVTSGVIPVTFLNSSRIAYGHSGILLVGCGASDVVQVGCMLDLSRLPTHTDRNELWHGTAALLACDPSGRNFGSDSTLYTPRYGQVTLINNLLLPENQAPSSYNFRESTPDWIGSIFAASLLYALQPPVYARGGSTSGAVGIGLLAGQLLFDDFTATFGPANVHAASEIQLSEVQEKMNKYISSATKVFMAGYDPRLDTSSLPPPSAITLPVGATVEAIVNQITLVGNKAMVISSMALLVVALRLLQLSLRNMFWKQLKLKILEPFGVVGVAKMQEWLEERRG